MPFIVIAGMAVAGNQHAGRGSNHWDVFEFHVGEAADIRVLVVRRSPLGKGNRHELSCHSIERQLLTSRIVPTTAPDMVFV